MFIRMVALFLLWTLARLWFTRVSSSSLFFRILSSKGLLNTLTTLQLNNFYQHTLSTIPLPPTISCSSNAARFPDTSPTNTKILRIASHIPFVRTNICTIPSKKLLPNSRTNQPPDAEKPYTWTCFLPRKWSVRVRFLTPRMNSLSKPKTNPLWIK